VISDSRLGPGTSIGAGCEVRESGIESSIVLGGARVHGVPDLHDSLIGRGAEVDGRAGASRVLLGDHSYTGLAL